MKRKFLLLVSLFATTCLGAQTLTFENLNLPIDTFWNGSDLTGKYEEPVSTSGDTFVAYNQYDTAFGGYWAGGYAVSTMTDDTTGDFTNLYGSIAGGGHNSDAYGVVNAGGLTRLTVGYSDLDFPLSHLAPRFMEAHITNTTYAHASMSNGDAFAKKFGGTTGDDPDYFFIRFYFAVGPDSAKTYVDSLDFYLADFRFTDNSQDYILDDWVYLDLNDYPAFEYYGTTVETKLFSSDASAFGINTPSFYCIDDVTIDYPTGVKELKEDDFNVSVKAYSFDVTNEQGQILLYDLGGNLVKSTVSNSSYHSISTSELPQGIYILQLLSENENKAVKVFRW